MTIRVTAKKARVLRVLLNIDASRKKLDPTYHMPNSRIMEYARVSSASFYTAIAELEREGWVESEKEVISTRTNRPPRTYYHLTRHGFACAEEAVRQSDARPHNRIRTMLRKLRGN